MIWIWRWFRDREFRWSRLGRIFEAVYLWVWGGEHWVTWVPSQPETAWRKAWDSVIGSKLAPEDDPRFPVMVLMLNETAEGFPLGHRFGRVTKRRFLADSYEGHTWPIAKASGWRPFKSRAAMLEWVVRG